MSAIIIRLQLTNVFDFQITNLDGNDLKHLDYSWHILAIHDITNATEYLSKHTKLVKNNPGLSWCLESGISKINKAISRIEKSTNESSQVLEYCKDTISKFNMVNEEANKDLDMFRYTIKRRSHVEFQKMKIESAWSDSLSQYNSTYKLLIERLEEKLAQFDNEKISKKDMSTQTGKISIVCLLTISKLIMMYVCIMYIYPKY